MEKNVLLRLVSTRYETGDAVDLFTGGSVRVCEDTDDTEGGISALGESAEPQTVELVTEAVMKSAGGRTELSYDESELSGLEGTETRLVFDAAQPDVVTMMRSGSVGVTMIFCPGLRHSCRYSNPLIPFDMTLMTHSLDNRLLTDGILELDYTTELPGSNQARTRLSLSLRETEE